MNDRRGEQPSIRVRIERLLPAPIDEVFAAWTDPAALSRWLSPTGRAVAEVDVRVGGHFRIVMLGDGMELEHTGRYVTVDPPRSLAFTWESPYTGSAPSIVTVTLRPEAQRTHLVLVHEGLPDDIALDHENGWIAIVGNLEIEVDATNRHDRHRREEFGA